MLSAEYARVAQLVEHDLAKVGAAGSSPVSRSFYGRKPLVQAFFFVCKKLYFIEITLKICFLFCCIMI